MTFKPSKVAKFLNFGQNENLGTVGNLLWRILEIWYV